VRIDHCSTNDMWLGVLPNVVSLRERQGARTMFTGCADPLSPGSYVQVRSGQIWKLQFNANTRTLVVWCNGRYLGCPFPPGSMNQPNNNNTYSKFGYGGARAGGNFNNNNNNNDSGSSTGQVQLPKLPDNQYYVAATCFMQPEDGVRFCFPAPP
jgi:hypothetical protein